MELYDKNFWYMEVNPRGVEGMGGGDERRRRGGSRWVVNCHYGDERVRSRSSAESCNKLNKKLQKISVILKTKMD